jgi:hypothetical protein
VETRTLLLSRVADIRLGDTLPRDMDLRRLGTGEWLLGAAAVALLVSLFPAWYSPGLGAWEAFAVLDVVLALIALFALAVLLVTATQSVPAVPVALDSLVALAGIAATVLIAVRALYLPDAAAGRDWALWFGLAAAAGVAAGGLLAMRDERLPRPGHSADHTGLPAPPPAPIETLPAPPGERAT